jgi:hypothetical protein
VLDVAEEEVRSFMGQLRERFEQEGIEVVVAPTE